VRLTVGLGLGFAVLAGLLIGALGVYQSGLVQARQLDLLQAQLLRQARLLSAEAAAALATGDPLDADAAAKGLGRQFGLRVTIFDPQGRVLGDSAADPARLTGERNRPEVRAVLDGSLYGVGLDGVRLYVAIPVESQGEVVGFIRVGDEIGPVEEAARQTLTAAGLAIAAAVPLGILFGLAGASLGRRPTGRILRGLRQLLAAQGGPPAKVADPLRAVGELVADLRQRVAHLEAEHRRLELVLDQMADGLIIADAQGNVVRVNPAAGRLLQVNPEEVVGRSLITVLKDHELAGFIREFLDGKAGAGRPPVFEIGPPGQRRTVQVKVSRTGGPDGHLVILLQDITEIKQTEQVRRDFVVNVSHELRTPVAALKALVETLEAGAVEDPEQAKEFIRRLQVEVDGLALLVEELFELARVESGRPALNRRPVDVGMVVRQAVERLRPLADRQGLNLLLRLPAELPPVQADPDRLEQVVLNLVHNAVKFTPPGGQVTVAVERRGDEVAVSVKDTGAGIPPELLPRVFERFFKADRARATKGSGLGLAIAKHIVQAHGGRIWAESAGEGRGATFTFTLPLAQT
jgi:two-component system phosphate regulon sensor histidine kinase PhoR